MNASELTLELESKAQRLAQHVWPRNVTLPDIERWAANFETLGIRRQKVTIHNHCLYILTHCIALRDAEFRYLLRGVFRELIRRPLIYKLRQAAGDTLDEARLQRDVDASLRTTRFVGLGAGAKSGPHLMYPLRKATGLSNDNIIASSSELLTDESGRPGVALRHHGVERYVLIDDVCGSGDTAVRFAPMVADLRRLSHADGIALRVDIAFVFATREGLQDVNGRGVFDSAQALVVFDHTYKTFAPASRYFQAQKAVKLRLVQRSVAKELFHRAGRRLSPGNELGFADCQLLLAFEYNTPDNTLPAIWSSGSNNDWFPLFERQD